MSEWVDPRSFAAFAHLKPAAPARTESPKEIPKPEKKEVPSLEPVGADPSFQADFSTEDRKMQEILSAAKKRAALGEEDWRILAMAKTIKGMLKKD